MNYLYTYLSAEVVLFKAKRQLSLQIFAWGAKINDILSNCQLRFVAKTSAGGPAGDAERKSNYGRPNYQTLYESSIRTLSHQHNYLKNFLKYQ